MGGQVVVGCWVLVVGCVCHPPPNAATKLDRDLRARRIAISERDGAPCSPSAAAPVVWRRAQSPAWSVARGAPYEACDPCPEAHARSRASLDLSTLLTGAWHKRLHNVQFAAVKCLTMPPRTSFPAAPLQGASDSCSPFPGRCPGLICGHTFGVLSAQLLAAQLLTHIDRNLPARCWAVKFLVDPATRHSGVHSRNSHPVEPARLGRRGGVDP